MAIDEQLMSPRMLTLWRKLRELVTYDPNLTVFGARSHKYRVYPCLTLSEIDDFEQQHKVVLPEDYREFLTQIGNGGVGPEYGLHRLQDSTRKDAALLSCPWPHHEDWNLAHSQSASPQDFNETYEDERQTAGSLSICEMGCGYEVLLVISGEERGAIWEDLRAGDMGIIPMKNPLTDAARLSFSDWYEMWLDKNLTS